MDTILQIQLVALTVLSTEYSYMTCCIPDRDSFMCGPDGMGKKPIPQAYPKWRYLF